MQTSEYGNNLDAAIAAGRPWNRLLLGERLVGLAPVVGAPPSLDARVASLEARVSALEAQLKKFPAVVPATQNLEVRVSSLETRVTALEAQVKALTTPPAPAPTHHTPPALY